MNIRDLTYLVALAEHTHFGLAAEACFVSQPALSMQLKKLEETLGVKLIERTNKSVFLTEIGKIMTDHAREILDRVDAMKQIAKKVKDPFSGELYLGIIPTLGPYLLPFIIPHLSKMFPKLTIYLIEDQTANLIDKLKNGSVDSVLLGLPLEQENFITLPLFEEDFLLATSSNHPLSKRKRISGADLENKTLLLLEEGHCMRDLALELCYKAKAAESKSLRATSLETLRHMVASKAGITLMPKLACNKNDGNAYIPFNAPKPSRIIGMVWRPTTAKTLVLNEIAKSIRLCMGKQKTVRIINTPILCSKKQPVY